MIKKVIGPLMLVFLFFAFLLYFAGIRYPISVSTNTILMLQRVERHTRELAFEIPQFPSIPTPPDMTDALAFLANLGNFFLGLFNMCISIINAIVFLLTFILILVNEATGFIDALKVTTPVMPVP